MDTLPIDDLDLKETIAAAVLLNNYSTTINDIAQNIYNNGLSKQSLNSVLQSYDIEKIEQLKNELLTFMIDIIKLVLNDYTITERERKNIALLKMYFKIKEGDFYKFKYNEIAEILNRQFEKIHEDGIVIKGEEMYKFEVQDLFDLSYDQFLQIKEQYFNKLQE